MNTHDYEQIELLQKQLADVTAERDAARNVATNILFAVERGEEATACDYCVNHKKCIKNCSCEMGDKFELKIPRKEVTHA